MWSDNQIRSGTDRDGFAGENVHHSETEKGQVESEGLSNQLRRISAVVLFDAPTKLLWLGG
jgi:hypothetical protein